MLCIMTYFACQFTHKDHVPQRARHCISEFSYLNSPRESLRVWTVVCILLLPEDSASAAELYFQCPGA